MPSPLGSRPFTSARCLTIFITFGLALTSASIEAQTFQVLHWVCDNEGETSEDRRTIS